MFCIFFFIILSFMFLLFTLIHKTGGIRGFFFSWSTKRNVRWLAKRKCFSVCFVFILSIFDKHPSWWWYESAQFEVEWISASVLDNERRVPTHQKKKRAWTEIEIAPTKTDNMSPKNIWNNNIDLFRNFRENSSGKSLAYRQWIYGQVLIFQAT